MLLMLLNNMKAAPNHIRVNHIIGNIRANHIKVNHIRVNHIRVNHIRVPRNTLWNHNEPHKRPDQSVAGTANEVRIFEFSLGINLNSIKRPHACCRPAEPQ